MTISTPTAITATAPDRTQAEATFNTNASATLSQLKTFSTELATSIGEMNTDIAQANTDATTASAASAAAVAASNATVWVSAGSYTAGDVHYSPITFKSYRAKTTHSGETTDPSADTTNWQELGGGSMILLSETDASSDASIDYDLETWSYDHFRLIIMNAVPATDAVDAWLRTATDGAGTFESGASDYAYNIAMTHSSISAEESTGAAQIKITRGTVGSDTNENGICSIIDIFQPTVSQFASIMGDSWSRNSDGASILREIFSGSRLAAADVTDLRFMFSSGNIESGKFKLYGVL